MAKKILISVLNVFLIATGAICQTDGVVAPVVVEERNLISDIVPVNPDNTINMVVEIPAGTNEKWEVTKPEGKLKLDTVKGQPRRIEYLSYPFNYGMIPQTLSTKERGGDGDPLDIISIGGPLTRGTVAKVKIIGVLKFLDQGEYDDKIVSVLPETSLYNVDTLEELDGSFPGITTIIKTWFLYYKGSGKMVFKGFGSRQEAQQIIESAIQNYKKENEEPARHQISKR